MGSVSAGQRSLASSSQVARSRRSSVSSAPSTKCSRTVSGMPAQDTVASRMTGPAVSTALRSSTESSLPMMASSSTSGFGAPGRGTMSMATSVVAPAPSTPFSPMATVSSRREGGAGRCRHRWCPARRTRRLPRLPRAARRAHRRRRRRSTCTSMRNGSSRSPFVPLNMLTSIVRRQRRDGGGGVDQVAGLRQPVDLDVGLERQGTVADTSRDVEAVGPRVEPQTADLLDPSRDQLLLAERSAGSGTAAAVGTNGVEQGRDVDVGVQDLDRADARSGAERVEVEVGVVRIARREQGRRCRRRQRGPTGRGAPGGSPRCRPWPGSAPRR